MVDWVRCCFYKVLPQIGSGISTTFNTSFLGKNVDLSSKDFWIFVYVQRNDPDCRFGIIPNNYLVENTWETLERGMIVTISCGECCYKGTVVYISEDYNYLKHNYFIITQEFLNEHEAYPLLEYQRSIQKMVTQPETTAKNEDKKKTNNNKKKTTKKKNKSDANDSKKRGG